MTLCTTSIIVHFPSGFLCYDLLYRIGLEKSYLFSLFLYKFQNFPSSQAPQTAIAFRNPAGDLLDSSQADIRNPLRYAALHRITASQFIRLYKIFRLSSQIFKTLLTVPSHFDGILLIK